jgi:hypothetical protein
MNKLIFLIGALLLAVTSCSENKTEAPTKEKPLLKTIQEINPSNGTTTTFTYEGDKITQASAGLYMGVYKIIYTYTGDLITQEDGYINNVLYVSTEYTYENSKLKTVIYKETNSGTISPAMNLNKLVYTYVSENSVDIDIYTYSNNNWELRTPFSKVKIYFSGGNIIKREQFNANGGVSSIVYEYDNSLNIYKNIMGFDKLFFTSSFTNTFNRHFNIHDISNTNNIIHTESDHYKYNYNSDGYPVEKHSYYTDTAYLVEKIYSYY